MFLVACIQCYAVTPPRRLICHCFLVVLLPVVFLRFAGFQFLVVFVHFAVVDFVLADYHI